MAHHTFRHGRILCLLLAWKTVPAPNPLGGVSARNSRSRADLYPVFEPSEIVRFDPGIRQHAEAKSRLGDGFTLGTRTWTAVFCLGDTSDCYFRVARGVRYSLLPIALSSDDHSPNEEGHYWKRIQILVWFLIAPCLVIVSLSTFIATFSLRLVIGPFVEHSVFGWFYRSAYIFTMIVAVGIALWITRRDGWIVVRRSLRWPPEKDILLGLFFSAGIGVLISIGSYLFDRVQWAAHGFGKYSPPQFGSYFGFPDPWFFLLFIAALSEELIFRGLLQRIFIEKYGVYRGIFLVGVVWAAFHFFSDSYSGATDFGVLQRLAFRVFMCLALGFVLSWLTLRSGSVLPAAVAHTIYNILVFSEFGPPFPGKATVRAALWAVLAYVLFRYWSVKEEDEPGAVVSIAETQAAT